MSAFEEFGADTGSGATSLDREEILAPPRRRASIFSPVTLAIRMGMRGGYLPLGYIVCAESP